MFTVDACVLSHLYMRTVSCVRRTAETAEIEENLKR